jgi:hypothetical protein
LLSGIGWIAVYSENSRLKSKIHDLELEIMPFRNYAVQLYLKADPESMKKLVQLMASQQERIDALNMEIEKLKKANDEAARNFFSQTAEETIPCSDTNRVVILTFTNDAKQVFIKLRDPAIPGSVTGKRVVPGYVNGETTLVSLNSDQNILFTYFVPGGSLRGGTFTVRYTVDVKATNRWNDVTIVDGNVFFDNVRMTFVPTHRQ